MQLVKLPEVPRNAEDALPPPEQDSADERAERETMRKMAAEFREYTAEWNAAVPHYRTRPLYLAATEVRAGGLRSIWTREALLAQRLFTQQCCGQNI